MDWIRYLPAFGKVIWLDGRVTKEGQMSDISIISGSGDSMHIPELKIIRTFDMAVGDRRLGYCFLPG
jgi:hypothetical protein